MPDSIRADMSGRLPPNIDPTANVLSLVEAANKRQDDLRQAAQELSDTKIAHQKEISDLRAHHQSELRRAEAERLDAIRQVDREDVTKTAAAAQLAISTLAAAATATAETLRTQVAATAAAAATQRAADMSELTKRLSALELAGSEGKGKQAYSDPQLAELVQQMKSMGESRASGTGRSAGMTWMIVTLIGFVTMAVALYAALKPH